MRSMRAIVAILAGIAIIGPLGPLQAAESAKSGYAGQQSRTIKALSDDDIAALRNGEGMGMAKPAELNGYPGPRHVLALARELDLSENQNRQVITVYERMSAAARPLGAALIERERAFDQLFARSQITPDQLTAETAAIGEIQARLRAVHLAAHLETRSILSAEQIAEYDRLRGYAAGGQSQHEHPGGGHRH